MEIPNFRRHFLKCFVLRSNVVGGVFSIKSSSESPTRFGLGDGGLRETRFGEENFGRGLLVWVELGSGLLDPAGFDEAFLFLSVLLLGWIFSGTDGGDRERACFGEIDEVEDGDKVEYGDREDDGDRENDRAGVGVRGAEGERVGVGDLGGPSLLACVAGGFFFSLLLPLPVFLPIISPLCSFSCVFLAFKVEKRK